MEQALVWAKVAKDLDEVPVGAIIVKDQEILGWGYNRREMDKNSLRHAEIDAINRASQSLGTWRLGGCTLYATLEPCLMCAGALLQGRISKVVYGALDPKGGAMGSLYSLHKDQRLNHQIEVIPGILSETCGELLKEFFRKKRKGSREIAPKESPLK